MASAPNRSSPLAVARRTNSVWRRLAPFLGTSPWGLLALAATAVLAGLLEASLLALIASVGTTLSQGAERVSMDLGPLAASASLGTTIIIGLVLAVLRGALQLLLAYLPARMSAAAMAGLRQRLFDDFTKTSWSVQASERDGHFQSLMSTHVSNASQAVITIGAGISASLMFGTLLLSAFVLSVPTALVLIVSSAVLFLLLLPLSRRLRRSAKALSAEFVEYSKGVQEIVLMAEETQVFGASEAFRRSIHGQIERVRAPLFRTRFLSQAVPALFQSVAYLVLVLALAFVSLLDATGIAQLGAVVLILIRSLTYGQQIQSAATRMDEQLPFMDRLRKAMDHYRAHPQQDGSQPLSRIERLEMVDVGFSYVADVDVLSGISFAVQRGEAVGIVGPSGAGKSSLVQLLLRLRDPDRGSLQVNGADARTFRRTDWQQRVAYVPQTSQLIWGTVADNIRFYRPQLSDDDIVRAARRAHVHDDIMSWPQGYDTVIGQRASAVSGGQRQRLCIARALAGAPDVLILDEPTSALDVASELAVQRSLDELKGEVIMFLVAHRLSTLAVCDRVMVVVGGRLEAIGEPQALLADNDFYRQVTEITRQQSAI